MKTKEISLFQKVNKFLGNFEIIILISNVILLSLLMFSNVVGRALNNSIIAAEEIAQLLIFITTFIGISYAARKARHIRMGAFLELLPERLKKVMVILTSAGTVLVMFYLAYHAIGYTLNMIRIGRVTPSLLWPYWIFLIWVPIGFCMTGIQYILTIIQNIKEPEVWWSPEEKSEYID